ncbi:MAG: hypothetical protein LUE17_04920 [Planctomycetaceae bacterium]|nr:hypothetical protein [Planctomycetaceae bacterium]
MSFNVALYLSLNKVHHQGIANGALRYAATKGWRIYGAYWPMYEMGEIASWRGDGIVAAVESLDELAELRKPGVPVVDISGAVAHPKLTRVSNNNDAIGRRGGEHLTALGYGRYCFAAAEGSLWSDERLRGFETASAGHREAEVAVFAKKYAW